MLIAVPLAFLADFLLIGAMVVRPSTAMTGSQVCRWAFSAMVVGLSVFHALGLLQLAIRTTLIIHLFLGLLGLIFLARRLRGLTTQRFRAYCTAGILIFLSLVFVKIMRDPLEGTDPRSIWFLHGRMIYLNQGLNAATDWREVSLGFSHPDYPKLVPYLAASITTVFGFWNDFLPKLSLACLFIICVIGFFRFYESSVRFWCIAFLCLLTPEWLIWNGYMDAYLAMAACLGVFYWSQYLETQESEDFLAGGLALALAAQLKHEGGAIFACALLPLVVFRCGKIWQFLCSCFPLLLAVLPVFQWNFLRHWWGITNDLQLGFSSLERINSRMEWDTALTLLRSVSAPTLSMLILVVLAPGLLALLRPAPQASRVIWFLSLFMISYALVLCAIYFATPHSLPWHLATSIDRTTLPLTMAGFVVLFRLWGQLVSTTRAPSEVITS